MNQLKKKYTLFIHLLLILFIFVFIVHFNLSIKEKNIDEWSCGKVVLLISELLIAFFIYNYYLFYNTNKGIFVYTKTQDAKQNTLKRYSAISLCVGLMIDILMWLPSFIKTIKLNDLWYIGYIYWLMIFVFSLIIIFLLVFIPLFISHKKAKLLKKEVIK